MSHCQIINNTHYSVIKPANQITFFVKLKFPSVNEWRQLAAS